MGGNETEPIHSPLVVAARVEARVFNDVRRKKKAGRTADNATVSQNYPSMLIFLFSFFFFSVCNEW